MLAETVDAQRDHPGPPITRAALTFVALAVLGCTTEPLWDTTMTGRWSGSSTDGVSTYRWYADLEQPRVGSWIRGTYESRIHPMADSAGWLEGGVYRGWFNFDLYDTEGGTLLCEWSGSLEDGETWMEGWLLCPGPDGEPVSGGLLVLVKRD